MHSKHGKFNAGAAFWGQGHKASVRFSWQRNALANCQRDAIDQFGLLRAIWTPALLSFKKFWIQKKHHERDPRKQDQGLPINQWCFVFCMILLRGLDCRIRRTVRTGQDWPLVSNNRCWWLHQFRLLCCVAPETQGTGSSSNLVTQWHHDAILWKKVASCELRACSHFCSTKSLSLVCRGQRFYDQFPSAPSSIDIESSRGEGYWLFQKFRSPSLLLWLISKANWWFCTLCFFQDLPPLDLLGCWN